jgi:hypothetical protein
MRSLDVVGMARTICEADRTKVDNEVTNIISSRSRSSSSAQANACTQQLYATLKASRLASQHTRIFLVFPFLLRVQPFLCHWRHHSMPRALTYVGSITAGAGSKGRKHNI